MTSTSIPDPSGDPATTAEGSRTAAARVAFRTCPLCEAGCGLEITVVDGKAVRIRGDRDDVFSRGFICPKGSTLRQLHDDPDRLRRPLIKRDGVHVEVDWPQAWAFVAERLHGVIENHGRESVGVYLGNPTAHSLSAMTWARTLIQALGTRSRFSASTVDQMPKQIAVGYMFGSPVSVPVPDLDRTHYLLMLGANPYASNGSLCTAPDFPGRLEGIRARGGRVVVVDPRRTRTAQAADEWVPIVPGTDALFLAAIAHELLATGAARPGAHLDGLVAGLDAVAAALEPFSPDAVAHVCGLDAALIRRVAAELVAAPSAAVYGRIGTTTTEFGTVTSWLVDVVNVLTGNLDRAGGAMFPLPAAGGANTRGRRGIGPGFRVGRSQTRVSGLSEVLGEYPVAALADEILVPGAGQLRALVTIAGNPVLSTPNGNAEQGASGGGRLDAAFEQLDLMVCVDMYLNETTRHADVILPPPSQLQRDHYDVFLLQFAVRDVANYSPAVLDRDDAGQPDEWEILARLSAIALGGGADADPATVDDRVIGAMVHHAVGDETSPVFGRDAADVLDELARSGRRGPARIVDFMVRTGPYGDAFGAQETGLTLDRLIESPHGIDLGALKSRLPEVLRTPSGMIELAPAVLVADLARLGEMLHREQSGGLLLVGRRDLRSNNSWMHNVKVLVSGPPRCTLLLHPDDARRLGVSTNQPVSVTSSAGTVVVEAEVTDDIRPGVVSLPHGWGHDAPGARMGIAAGVAGVNSNHLSDHLALDPLSGTSVLTAIPVSVVPALNVTT